jgi:predicted acetyltransferase
VPITELFLVKPQKRYHNSFLAAVQEIQAENPVNPFSATMSENNLDVEGLRFEQNFARYLDHLFAQASQKETSADGRVPNTTLWLIGKQDDGDEIFLGRVNVRHYLTPQLRNSFGHISYLIRPSARGKGFGRQILKLALAAAKELVTDLAKFDHKVLVTCKAKNLISKKIIIGAGGVFDREVVLPTTGPELLYFIAL